MDINICTLERFNYVKNIIGMSYRRNVSSNYALISLSRFNSGIRKKFLVIKNLDIFVILV